MSTAEMPSVSDHFADVVIPLMKEYTQKFTEVREQLQTLIQTSSGNWSSPTNMLREGVEELDQFCTQLWVPTKELADVVSQQVEHGNLCPLTRLELRLRLAELEHALSSAKKLVQRVQAKIKG